MENNPQQLRDILDIDIGLDKIQPKEKHQTDLLNEATGGIFQSKWNVS